MLERIATRESGSGEDIDSPWSPRNGAHTFRGEASTQILYAPKESRVHPPMPEMGRRADGEYVESRRV